MGKGGGAHPPVTVQSTAISEGIQDNHFAFGIVIIATATVSRMTPVNGRMIQYTHCPTIKNNLVSVNCIHSRNQANSAKKAMSAVLTGSSENVSENNVVFNSLNYFTVAYQGVDGLHVLIVLLGM